MSETPSAPRPRVALGTTFLTGEDGRVYELPLDVAERYVVTPERERALGHLPILPYTKLQPKPDDDDGFEVGGRHLVQQENGLTGYHTEWVFGTYRSAVDGNYYSGIHRHPYGGDDPHAVGLEE